MEWFEMQDKEESVAETMSQISEDIGAIMAANLAAQEAFELELRHR